MTETKDKTTEVMNWPRLAGKYLTALNEAERMCNERRDEWIEARRMGDGDLYRLGTDEALKWEAVSVFIRAVTGGAHMTDPNHQTTQRRSAIGRFLNPGGIWEATKQDIITDRWTQILCAYLAVMFLLCIGISIARLIEAAP